MEETELPLLSNINNVRARHYLICFQTDVVSQSIFGTVIIFFDTPSSCEYKGGFCTEKCSCFAKDTKSQNAVPINNMKSEEDFFPIILECNDLAIKSVDEVKSTSFELRNYTLKNLNKNGSDFKYWNGRTKNKLAFTQDKWSININYNSSLFCTSDFPKVICISYSTKPVGESLLWRKCNDNEPCFFTSGSFINNRSLFPSQDRPLAMATWEAWVIIPKGYCLSMTGDNKPVLFDSKDIFASYNGTLINNDECFYCYSNMVLPTATIAIAVGKWRVYDLLSHKEVDFYNKKFTVNVAKHYIDVKKIDCHHVVYPCHIKRTHSGPLIPVTLVSPLSLMPKASALLSFVKFILVASSRLLGRYPFNRLEFVILPRCFPNLGLASPNVIYLSKAILVDDSSLYLRLAHEISHSWFGITIGPKNWEEEWLSEGFATYLEDIIYALAAEEESREKRKDSHNLDLREICKKYNDLFYLRGHIRYLTLVAEKENSSEELQILSPDNLCSSQEKCSLKNSLNSDKAFLQVHYLKGYFLLHKLSSYVSRHYFDEFLGLTANNFHGQLINSQDFLDAFYKHFPNIGSHISQSKILKEWLTNPDINEDISNSFGLLPLENLLFRVVIEHKNFWLQFDRSFGKKDFDFSKKFELLKKFKLTYSDEIVVLFEEFLLVKKIKVRTLSHICSFYKVQNRNSDIKHRWCELVIKHNYPNIACISNFLIENQAMGVYLYGELVISRKEKHKMLAKSIYHDLKEELDPKSKFVISSMIFGT